VLILAGVVAGLGEFKAGLRYYQAATSVMQDTAESQVSYEALGIWGDYKVYKPPAKLSAVIEGLENHLGRSAVLSIFDAPQLQETKLNEQPIFAIFGTLDLGFVVRVVLSLFAILYTFDSISGERERGTLKLMLANSVPRDTIILGKLFGSFCGLVLPLTIPLLIGILILALAPGYELGVDDWMRLAGVVFLSLLYVTVFLMIGIFVSTRTGRSSTSFLVLLVTWVFLVLIVPRVTVLIAAKLSPVPSGTEVLAQKQELRRQNYREYSSELNRWLREHPERMSLPRDERVPATVENEIAQRLDERSSSHQGRLDEDFESSKRRQRSLSLWLSRISPTAAYSHATMALAQTGIDRQERFLEAVRVYRRQFQDYVRGKMRQESRDQALGVTGPGGSGNRLDVSDLPKLVFQEEGVRTSLRSAWIDSLVLLLFTAIFFAGSYFSFLTYDVR
jgi:ABC-type transport system involved in multi-copper enzyme maturation permease subunit